MSLTCSILSLDDVSRRQCALGKTGPDRRFVARAFTARTRNRRAGASAVDAPASRAT